MVGDIATVTVQLLRKNLHEGEASDRNDRFTGEELKEEYGEIRVIGFGCQLWYSQF